ncbi:hypothetical protein [Paraburkholderia strydomiana]
MTGVDEKLGHPQPVKRSDNQKSKMPRRDEVEARRAIALRDEGLTTCSFKTTAALEPEFGSRTGFRKPVWPE